jgi:2-oxo-4-hydroxy-4-carboxy-5-ureidoimidazoline decarboxylase
VTSEEAARGGIEALNAASADDFAAAVAPLFEQAPRFLVRLAAARPFASWPAFFDAARSIAHAMPEADQLALVDAHPRLGAPPASVSQFSFGEQGYDRDVAASLAADASRARERAATDLEQLNRAYEARFGFRYCVFVAGRPLADLIPGLEAALGADRDAELQRALDAVVDIARARHEAVG